MIFFKRNLFCRLVSGQKTSFTTACIRSAAAGGSNLFSDKGHIYIPGFYASKTLSKKI